MPRSQGTYTLPAVYLATPGTEIRSEQHNTPLEDVAQAITGSLARDGSSPMLGDLPMNGRRIRNLGAGTAPGDAVRLDQVPADIVAGTGLEYGTGLESRTMSLAGQARLLHDLTGAGIFARSGSGALALRTIEGGEGVTVTRGNGGPGNPSIAVDATVVRTTRAVNTGAGLTGGGPLDADRTLALTGQALALHNATGVGLFARTGSGAPALRTLIGGTGINIAAGNGGPADPTISAAIASPAQARAGTANDVLMTPLRVAQAGLPAPAASNSWVFWYQVLRSFNHGLGRNPRLVQWYLECTTANNGYSVGDRINLSAGSAYTNDPDGLRAWSTGTVVGARVGVVRIVNPSDGGQVNLVGGIGGENSWRLVVEVW